MFFASSTDWISGTMMPWAPAYCTNQPVVRNTAVMNEICFQFQLITYVQSTLNHPMLALRNANNRTDAAGSYSGNGFMHAGIVHVAMLAINADPVDAGSACYDS